MLVRSVAELVLKRCRERLSDGLKNKGGFLQCPSVVKGRCACTNCKYADHAGTIIIELDYE